MEDKLLHGRCLTCGLATISDNRRKDKIFIPLHSKKINVPIGSKRPECEGSNTWGEYIGEISLDLSIGALFGQGVTTWILGDYNNYHSKLGEAINDIKRPKEERS